MKDCILKFKKSISDLENNLYANFADLSADNSKLEIIMSNGNLTFVELFNQTIQQVNLRVKHAKIKLKKGLYIRAFNVKIFERKLNKPIGQTWQQPKCPSECSTGERTVWVVLSCSLFAAAILAALITLFFFIIFENKDIKIQKLKNKDS